MKIEAGSLVELAGALRARVELDFKRDIQLAARAFGRETRSAWIPAVMNAWLSTPPEPAVP